MIKIRSANILLGSACGMLLLIAACNRPYRDWKVYGGTNDHIHYSALTEIDTSNVNGLRVVWTYHTHDADSVNHSQVQCNPIVINGVLYATSPRLKLLALDAATGSERWVFNPQDSIQKPADFIINNNRGVTYWEDGTDKRIFYTAGPILYAIDAGTGRLIPSFGNKGRVDLHEGLGRDVADLSVTATTPGTIFENLLIMGTRVSEGSDAAPGHIRAYDTRSGALKWIFHSIPQPGEKGYETWEDPVAYQHIGGANCWSGFSLDEKRGILFVPTGSASFDFYGGKRKGTGLYANCILALDAATGKYIWHFQTVHHDVWDKDLPVAPALVSVMHNGELTDAVAQPTKTGFIFLFDRATGKPLFPVEEKPVPTNTELQGEKLWATQPIPTLPKPFVRQVFSDSDVNDLVPDTSIADIRKRLACYITGNMFNAPSRQGTVILPGFDGGAEWGGPAFDPASGLLFVNANEMPWVLTMTDLKNEPPKKETYPEAGKRLYLQNCMTCHGPERKGSGNNPPLLGVQSKYNETQLTQLISTGRRMMPAFKDLSTDERSAIASWILELKANAQKSYVTVPKPVDTFRNLPFSMTGYNKFLSKEGYPAIKPPWGTLSAIDLNTGELSWKIPLGTYPAFVQKGIVTGTENYGGPVVTAGGLLFIAATRDGKFRAFNKRTGQLLWEATLPAPGFATPAIYTVDGKQYVAIACGGGKLGTSSADAYVVFALPGK